MKRRTFIESAFAAGMSGTLATSCDVELPSLGGRPEKRDLGDTPESGEPRLPTVLAEMSLEDLKEDYRQRLFNRYLPFWDKGGYDEERGGFMCILNDDGTVADDEKYLGYQGCGLWVYSFLYNNFRHEPRYLEIAGKTRDFMVKYMKAEKGTWYERVNRDGSVKEGVSDNIYGWIYTVNGLAEYYKATEQEDDLKMIYETIWASLRVYDSYNYTGSRNWGGLSEDMSFVGFREQGHSMVLIRLLTQLLNTIKNRKLEDVQEEHVDNVMNKFYNSQLHITNEYLLHDYTRVPGYEDYMYTGQSIETLWTIMFEALRKKDQELFISTIRLIRRYLEISWDYVFEGFGDGHFYVFDGPDRTREKLYGVKSMWSHCEVLIALLHVIEYSPVQWAKEWYERVHRYTMKNFDTDYGVWKQEVDRFGNDTKREGVSLKDNFHQPRYLMLSILCLERMIENQGKPTEILG